MTGVVGPARRRRPLVVATAVTAALGLGGLAAVVIAGRPGPSPVLAIVAAANGGLPVISVDEGAGRAYVAIRLGSGPGGAAAVRVLDVATGALVGTAPLPAPGSIGSGGAVVAVAVDARRGRAYAVSAGSSSCTSSGGGPQTCVTTGAAILVLDARVGRTLGTLAVDAGGALAVDQRTGLLYTLPIVAPGAPSGGGTTLVRAIDPGTGRTVRTIALPGGGQGFGQGTLAIDGRGTRLIVARTLFGPSRVPSSVDVVDLTRERLLRHTPLPGVGGAGGGFSTAALIDEARGRAVLRTGTGMAVLDLRSGALLRVTPLGAGVGALGEDARTGREALVAQRERNEIVGALGEDARTGRVFTTTLGAWRTVTTRTPTGASTTSVPAGVGSLQVLDAHSGALRRSLPIDLATTGLAVDERRGRVYVLSIGAADARNGLTRPGTLSVVDERSGQVVRTLAIGAVPFTLALDRRADRIFVGCIGAFGGTPDDPWGWVPAPVRRLLPFLPRPPAPIRTPQGSLMILDPARL